MSHSPLVAIVDDDPDVRASLDSLMRSAGLDCRCFAGAGELLAETCADAIGCVVTDLNMPGMSGLELQQELVRRGWELPLIVMTAYPTDATRSQAMDAGAAAYLTKPVDPDVLLEAIEIALH